MVDDAVELVRLRNKFYRDNYRRFAGVFLFLLVIIALLIGIIFYQATHPPKPRYVASTADGKIMKLFPLSAPMLSSEELLQWAEKAAIAAYSYDFVNYRDAFQKMQNEFTADGWRYYESALKGSRNLDLVLAKELVVSAVVTGAPVILDQKDVDGIYFWKVQLPLLVSYQSLNDQTQKPVTVMMVICRVPTVDKPKGIAIISFVASEGAVGN